MPAACRALCRAEDRSAWSPGPVRRLLRLGAPSSLKRFPDPPSSHADVRPVCLRSERQPLGRVPGGHAGSSRGPGAAAAPRCRPGLRNRSPGEGAQRAALFCLTKHESQSREDHAAPQGQLRPRAKPAHASRGVASGKGDAARQGARPVTKRKTEPWW